jgi:photosystem II stability/assembly factor-like uncharacterized protein
VTRRAMLTGAAVGVMALVATALVVLALRPAADVRPPVAPLEIGAVAAGGDVVWRWVGPENCNADADVVQLERSQGGGAWTTSAIPLANVYSLSFANTQDGVATGTTSTCSRGVAVTSDGGRTWKSSTDNPVLLDAWYQGTTIWGVERTVGQPTLAAYRPDPRLRLRPVPGVEPIQPCAASDGVPDQIAFWTDTKGLLLCQNTVIGNRLLARTTNGGASFEALADDRPALGLDGSESITDLDVAGETNAWVVFEPGGGCPEGQVRASDSEGAVFERLTCPSKSERLQEVLDVAFTSPQDGVMLALRDREALMLTTSDGGRTWKAVAEKD